MRLIIAFFAILFCCSALADVRNPNPNLTISIIGAESFNVSGPGQVIPNRFVVRLVDPQGNPVDGLTVAFFSNVSGCFAGDPHCTPPPRAMYGHFTDGAELVLTDANGVARSNSYISGTLPGQYDVVGAVYYSLSDRNAEIMKTGADPTALFAINQFVVPSLPATGLFALSLLAAAIVLLTFWRNQRRISRSVL